MLKDTFEWVGKKFDSDGNSLYFPGTTIICKIEKNSSEYDEIKKIYDEFLGSEISKHFAILPKSSFNMTVFELYNDFERDQRQWSNKIDIKEPTWIVNDKLKRLIAEVKQPEPFKMKPVRVNSNCITLVPIDEKNHNIIWNYRNDISESTGIRFPEHDDYEFHVSFSYKVREMPELIQKECDIFCDMLTKKLLQKELIFEIRNPQYCYFTDMSDFIEW